MCSRRTSWEGGTIGDDVPRLVAVVAQASDPLAIGGETRREEDGLRSRENWLMEKLLRLLLKVLRDEAGRSPAVRVGERRDGIGDGSPGTETAAAPKGPLETSALVLDPRFPQVALVATVRLADGTEVGIRVHVQRLGVLLRRFAAFDRLESLAPADFESLEFGLTRRVLVVEKREDLPGLVELRLQSGRLGHRPIDALLDSTDQPLDLVVELVLYVEMVPAQRLTRWRRLRRRLRQFADRIRNLLRQLLSELLILGGEEGLQLIERGLLVPLILSVIFTLITGHRPARKARDIKARSN